MEFKNYTATKDRDGKVSIDNNNISGIHSGKQAVLLPNVIVRPKGFWSQVTDEMSNNVKEPIDFITAPVTAAISLPQQALTYAISGKIKPSDALGVKNKLGAFATDAVLDPMNLVGANVLSKGRLASKAESIAKNIPGLTVDAPELGFHALNSQHWALHPGILKKQTSESLVPMYAMASLNRALPVIKHTPLVIPIRNIAKDIMSTGSGYAREVKDISSFLKNKNKYFGMVQNSPHPIDRNLINTYLFGSEKGMEKIDKDMITLDFGDRYKKLYPNSKYYKLSATIPNNEPISIKNAIFQKGFEDFYSPQEIFNNISNKKEMRTGIESEFNFLRPIDDISGHQTGLKYDNNGKPIYVTQDLWKFNPKDYTKRWADSNSEYAKLLIEKQSGIIDKLGKPFYLVQNNPISLDNF